MRRIVPCLLLAFVVASGIALGGGCIQVSDYDPVGTAASVRGGWTIDGQLPTADSCGVLGANFVRVSFLDGTRAVPHPGLTFRCTDAGCAANEGTGQCFDTGSNRVVAEGVWNVRLEAITGSGRLLAVGPTQTWDTTSAEVDANLIRADFFTGTVNASFVIDGMPPTALTCDELGIAEVSLAFDVAPAQVATTMREPCAVGGVGTRVAPGAGYVVRVEAWNAAGERVREYVFEPFDVTPGVQFRLGGDGHVIELRAD